MPTFWNAVMPPIDDTWMMWPLRCARRIRQRGLGDPQRAEHVGLDLVARLGLGELLDEAELAVAGVVDDDVEPAEVVVGLLDRGEVGVAVGHVERDRQQRVAVLRRRGRRASTVSRAVAATLSPRSSAAIAHSRPKPRDVPVMNQTFSLMFGVHAPQRRCASAALPIPASDFTGSVGRVSRASLEKDPHEVASMFDAVARRYDLTNTVLSLGQDRFWRRATRSALQHRPGGQGARPRGGDGGVDGRAGGSPARGVWPRDFSVGMLAAGAGAPVPKVAGDATRLPFADGVVRRGDDQLRAAQRRRPRRRACGRWRG